MVRMNPPARHPAKFLADNAHFHRSHPLLLLLLGTSSLTVHKVRYRNDSEIQT